MKTVCKKLLSLMLVAILLISAVPMAFATDGGLTMGELTTGEVTPGLPDPDAGTASGTAVVNVPVHVMLDGKQIGDVKTLTIKHGEAATLNHDLAKTKIQSWENRKYVGWADKDGSAISTLSFASAMNAIKNDNAYYLILNLTKCDHAKTHDEVTTAATCKNDGMKKVVCDDCGHVENVAIPKTTDHQWEERIDAPATCKAKGQKTLTCKTCNATKIEEIPMTDHNWDNGVITTQPTCTEQGVKTYTCQTCGAKKTEAVAALGHNYENGICTRCKHGAAKYQLTFKFLDENGSWKTTTQEISNTETINFPIVPNVKGKRMAGWGNDVNNDIKKVNETYAWYVGQPQNYTAKYTETTDDNMATLSVWANYYVNGEYHHREFLYSKDFARSQGNEMFTWLYSNEGMEKTRNAVFGGGANSTYQWANEMYYNYFGDAAITAANMKADGDKNVYIKVTSKKAMEARVLLYTHLKDSKGKIVERQDEIIEIAGKTAGDYVSAADVKKAVQTKYTGSKMTISDLYTEDNWDRLIAGQNPSGAASVKVMDNGVTEIHVVLTNATNKSNSKADKSNPKTGDDINVVFTTMTVSAMGLAAVAVLKKRKMI